jgi:hypothetical protein
MLVDKELRLPLGTAPSYVWNSATKSWTSRSGQPNPGFLAFYDHKEPYDLQSLLLQPLNAGGQGGTYQVSYGWSSSTGAFGYVGSGGASARGLYGSSAGVIAVYDDLIEISTPGVSPSQRNGLVAPTPISLPVAPQTSAPTPQSKLQRLLERLRRGLS